jgi:hypothetical protein
MEVEKRFKEQARNDSRFWGDCAPSERAFNRNARRRSIYPETVILELPRRHLLIAMSAGHQETS